MATVDLLELPGDLRVVRVESPPFGENSYLLFREGRPGCVIVDPGFEPEAIVAAAEARRLEPQAILVTHGHSDHIAGNAALRARWPGLPILIGRHDAAKLTDPEANLSAPFGLRIVSPPADRLLDDGETVAVAGLEFLVRQIPGHSRGHVVFIVPEDDATPPLVLAGDVLFRQGVGRTDFPDGDTNALTDGIRSVLYALPGPTVVLPGHGDTTTVDHERRFNPFVSGAAGQH